MVAFFGCMYYAALRPEEAVELRPDNLASLPDQVWGELILTSSEPRSGTWWTDSGSARQRRELKHRPRGETRPVHPPELVALLSVLATAQRLTRKDATALICRNCAHPIYVPRRALSRPRASWGRL